MVFSSSNLTMEVIIDNHRMGRFSLLSRFVLFICMAIQVHSSFRFGSRYGKKFVKFAPSLPSTTARIVQVPPDLSSIFDDVSMDLETSTYVPGTFTGMERVVLTANGNLQRILSSYYGAPVRVHIKRCTDLGNNTFDREVDLLVHGQVVCTAVGQISIYSEEGLKAIRDQKIGVGQLFRHFKVMPSFKLLRAGRRLAHNNGDVRDVFDTLLSHDIHHESFEDSKDGAADTVYAPGFDAALNNASYSDDTSKKYSMWREYELYTQHMHCRFVERFPPGFLNFSFS